MFRQPVILAAATVLGFPYNVHFSPDARTMPPSSTDTFSHRRKASEKSWVTISEMPSNPSSASATSRSICHLKWLSSAENGSSKRISLGCDAIILASATRCCCPPDSCAG